MHKRFKPFSFSENMVCQKGKCAANARSLILKNKWTQRKEYRSRKYLYTLAQLVDYLNENEGKNSLWNKPIEVIYLMPDGGDITGGGKTCPGISLRTAVRNLCPIPGEEPYINLLQSIIAKIYWCGGKKLLIETIVCADMVGNWVWYILFMQIYRPGSRLLLRRSHCICIFVLSSLRYYFALMLPSRQLKITFSVASLM